MEEVDQEDLLMQVQMYETSNLQDKITDIFGNALDMTEGVNDSLTKYEY